MATSISSCHLGHLLKKRLTHPKSQGDECTGTKGDGTKDGG